MKKQDLQQGEKQDERIIRQGIILYGFQSIEIKILVGEVQKELKNWTPQIF